MPGSGIILPEQLARTVLSAQMFGNHGAYRTAAANNKNTVAWVTSNGSADADTLFDLQALRQQSSDLIRNEPLPAGIIAGTTTAVVGTGVVPQARIDAEFLGISEEAAAKWQRQAERIFNHVAGRPWFDLEGKETFWQQQSTVFRAKQERGDVFAVRRLKRRKGKLLGLCVQLVEGDRCYTPMKEAANDKVRAGIRHDADGMPTGFFFSQQHPGDRGLVMRQAFEEFTEISAQDDNGDPLVLPIIPRLRPGQTRGVPMLAPVIEMLKQLSRYTEAEVAAAVVSGMLAVMVTSPAPTSPLGPGIPGMVNGTQVAPKGNGLQRMQSGMIVDLAPGEEVQVVKSERPNTAFDPFVTALLRQIGSALEVPFEVLIKHFSASYSASRAALLEAWRYYAKERTFLVETYCQPVYTWVITEAVARGLLDAPGFFDNPLAREAWLGTEWIGQSMPSIDPEKEARAATAWNALNVLPLQSISASMGRDHDRDAAQIVREKKWLDANGLCRPGEVQGAQQLQIARETADNAPADNQDNNP